MEILGILGTNVPEYENSEDEGNVPNIPNIPNILKIPNIFFFTLYHNLVLVIVLAEGGRGAAFALLEDTVEVRDIVEA